MCNRKKSKLNGYNAGPSSSLKSGIVIKQEGDIMETFNSEDLSAYESEFDIDELLEQHDRYINALARKKIPRNLIPPEMLSDEIDELAQKIRIKLWQVLQKQQIIYPRAYLNCIAYTESIDMVRRYKSAQTLFIRTDCETYPGNSKEGPDEGVEDPAKKLEQEEEITGWLKGIAEEVCMLPPRQLQAMICSLKDQIDDFLPLLDALRSRGVYIEEINWPCDREEVRRLQVSLSIARKKLRRCKK
jgi:DNA-directed RNA polymerase specialized sigma24 family protein